MAKRGIKKKEFERLDDATVSRVVSLLEQDKPITKKAACEILNISYNTKRLGSIIQEYKDKIAFAKKRRAAIRGTAFSDLEIQQLVADYLNGDSISNISESLYRSINSVKKKITELHLPERTKKSASYFEPEMLPDAAVSEEFNVGELVWSSRYNAVVEIREGQWDLINQYNVYKIFVFGKHNEFAFQPAYELGKLEILKKFNIPAEKFIKTQKSPFNYRID